MKKFIATFVAAALMLGSVAGIAACSPADPSNTVEVTGITITQEPTRTHYVLGESFDPAGMKVSKVMSDKTNTVLEATEYTYAPAGALALKDKKVTITYKEGEKSFTCSQTISVTNDVKSVEVKSNPTKMDYISGETFNPAGMTIQATLENGTKEDVIEVTAENVQYKTTGLVKSDEHFEMTYGGCKFYLEIKVVHGASTEAESGLIIAAGAKMGDDGPCTPAIEMDRENGPDLANGGNRGLDEGTPRCAVTSYVNDHLEWTETTGGTISGSGRRLGNHVSGENGGKILYAINADKAGTATMIFKMANPNISGSVATEIKLNQLLTITVNGTKANIPDSVKLEGVDWTQYKSYNRDTKDYTGDSCVPTFFWQNIGTDVSLNKGDNSIVVEFLYDKPVCIDTVSYNADAAEINLKADATFAPTLDSAKLKVSGEKVLAGLIINPHSVGYNDDAIKTVLELMRIEHSFSASSDGYNGRDPWTTSPEDGGLGYSDRLDSAKEAYWQYKANMTTESVEKVKEGEFTDCFILWYDVTIPSSKSVDKVPETNRYRGAWYLNGFNYGATFKNDHPVNSILKDDEDVTAELGGYCYQIYCDNRDENSTFASSYLMLIVQDGTFKAGQDNTRNLLGRRFIDGRTDNDPKPEA